MYLKLKDTGHRKIFDTGCEKDAVVGKGRPDLINPFVLFRDALHYENGAYKYDDRNWEHGMPMSEASQSLGRHWMQYMEGDRGEDHLAAIRFWAAALMFVEEMIKRGFLPPKLNDLPRYFPSKCITHKKYKGIKPPKTKCKVCWAIYWWNKYYDDAPENWSFYWQTH